MSHTKNNALTKNYRGKFGNQFVLRNRNGKSIMAAMPMRKNDSMTPAQAEARRRFANASQYAKNILLDPDMQVAYAAKATGGMSAYNVAMTDYLKAPWVEEIDVTAYTGNSGEKIRVQAFDDFMVTEVTVKIIAPDETIVESGPCELDTLGIWWEYTATQSIADLTGHEIIATARDLPGHTGTASYLYE